jgi:hypothetical protein
MSNAKYVSELCGYSIPLGSIKYDMKQANLTIKWRRDITSQTAYVLDETDIDIPDIKPLLLTNKARVMAEPYGKYRGQSGDLDCDKPADWYDNFMFYWQAHNNCYVLDEC